jgi:membrane protease YdiL (CAAX protease family)
MLNKADSRKESHNTLRDRSLLIAFFAFYALLFATPRFFNVFSAKQTQLLIQAVAYGICGVSGIFLFRREFILGIRNWKSAALKNILWLVGAFAASTFIVSIAAYPAYSMGFEDVTNANRMLLLVQIIGKPLTVLVVGISGPITEECVYRAFLIGKAKTKLPLWVCVILSSLLFAAMHLHGFTLLNFLSVLPTFASGLIYAVAYAATGNITVPLLMHILNNMVGIILYAGQ